MAVSLLTLAGLNAFEPRVIKVKVARVTAIFEPSATSITTTNLAKFVGTALRACVRGSCRINRRACYCRYIRPIKRRQTDSNQKTFSTYNT